MTTPRADGDQVVRSAFTSADDAEVTEFIRRMYAENRTRFAPLRGAARFSARTNDLPALGADHVRTSIDYNGTSAEGFSDYTFFVVHSGSVQLNSPSTGTTAGPGDVSVYPLGVPIEFTMDSFDVTTLRLPAQRVARAAEELTGRPAAEFRLLDITPVSPSMTRYWRSLVGVAAAAMQDPDSPLRSPLLAEDMARTLAHAALRAFPNSTMMRQHEPGPGATAPATVGRALDHIEENAHRPLSLTEIAGAADTSARALQYGFRRHLGSTPLAHLRRVRLERAHHDLERADPTRGDTVAAIANSWGFTNAGRFAAAHEEAYGVAPHRTLRH